MSLPQASRDGDGDEDDAGGAGRYPPSSPPSSAATAGGSNGAQLSKVVSFSDVTDTPYDDADHEDEEEEYDEDEDATPRHRPHHHRSHRHSTAAASSSPGSAGAGQAAMRRRSSVKSSSESGGGGAQCAKRRTSVPAAMMRVGESHTLGRRSPRNPQFVHQDELWLSQRPSRGTSPSTPGSSTPPQPGSGALTPLGPRSPHASSPYLLNGGGDEDRDRGPSLHYLSSNSSTPSVPAAVMAERLSERDRGYGELLSGEVSTPIAPRGSGLFFS